MEENTIFEQPQNPTPSFPAPQAPAGPPPADSGSFSPPPPPVEEEGSPFGKIVKIAIGIFALILIIVFAVFLVPKFLGGSNEKVTLSYWGLWEDEKVMQSIISDFQRQNPNITINYTRQDIKQYREKLSTRIANGTGPDIFRFHNSWLPVFEDTLLPLPNSVITKEDFEKNYYKTAGRDLVKDGAIYGIPLGIDTLALYINVDLFDAAGASPPTNWDDFQRLSRQLTVKDEENNIKTAGAAMGTFDNINHAPDIISMLFFQNGADIYNLAGTPEKASDALSFYTSFATGDANVWDNNLPSSIALFAQGNLAMYFGYSWDFFTIRAISPQLNFLVTPVPSLPGQDITTASYWVEGVSSKSKNQEAAFAFMKYLATREAQQRLFAEASKTRLYGQPYSRQDLSELLADNKNVKPFIEQAKNAQSSFFAGDTYDSAINSQMNAYLGNAVRSILNGDSSLSAIETLSLGVAQVLGQYAEER